MPLPSGVSTEEVGVLSVRDAARLVALARPCARRGRDGLLLGYVALGLFAGLRPERELGLVRLDGINLEEGTVVVDAGSAKSRSRRVVDVPGNAVALLRIAVPLLRAAGLSGVVPRNFRKRWAALRGAAGLLEDWPADGMRHSYASYHFAMWQNEHLLKAQMGHAAGSEVLWQHYRARVARAERVQAFHAITRAAVAALAV
jgi:integrase